MVEGAGFADARAQCMARGFVEDEAGGAAGVQIFGRDIDDGIGQTLLSITLIPK